MNRKTKTIAIERKPSTREERKAGPILMGFIEFTPTPAQEKAQAKYQRYRAQQAARAALEDLFDIRPEHQA